MQTTHICLTWERWSSITAPRMLNLFLIAGFCWHSYTFPSQISSPQELVPIPSPLQMAPETEDPDTGTLVFPRPCFQRMNGAFLSVKWVDRDSAWGSSRAE